ncbi:ABC transporter ATP-binding protein [Actinoallomurus purpureus]|uniref:dipeptide ABC transporter ATP-binding protein n=1 Tax=Actinoallomurus purpureus TaxID=478114 RepID=UPI002092FBF7|nr:ABC transporter ATP-binding protein [Actinoallomurus purpureus]MCO6008929.1 ABC transporter ATP-binding protein [Actinoallomurus purpureus]
MKVAAADDPGQTQKDDARRGEAVLRCRDFNVRYGTAPDSVRAVDLTVRAGEIVGLIGESGSGKTSVAMACLGLLPKQAHVSAETFEVCGTDLAAADDKALTRLRGSEVAMVFQDAMGALDPSMRVGRQIGEVVARHRGLKGKARQNAVLELLRRVRVPEPEHRARQYPHQLSGGLRQRVAMALALAGEPRLLLADEPTTALDVTVQAEILRLLRTVRDEFGVGILLISHDIGVIAQTADRVAVMRDGEIVESGAVEDVLLRPTSDYTRMLLGSVPKLGERARRRPAEGAGGGTDLDGAPLFVVDGLSRSFRARGRVVHAVRDVSLRVGRGEVLGVVGESGSGKSTLAKMLVRLDQPSAGRLEMNGADYGRLRGKRLKAFRRAVQMVFQHPAGSLNPKLRVVTSMREPLAAGGVTGGEARRRIDEVLAEVGVPPETAGRLPHEFSGGQKQRIAIARAIAARPQVVVLDEPTSALDVSVQAQVLDLLLKVQQAEELTYVFISHDLAVVQAISDRVMVMYAGRVVEIAEAEALFASPAHWYTRALLEAVPSPDPRDRPESGAASPPDTGDRPEEARGCVFAARCPRAESRCRAEAPELSTLSAGHAVACHFPADREGSK